MGSVLKSVDGSFFSCLLSLKCQAFNARKQFQLIICENVGVVTVGSVDQYFFTLYFLTWPIKNIISNFPPPPISAIVMSVYFRGMKEIFYLSTSCL
jgi:hypothetical protein